MQIFSIFLNFACNFFHGVISAYRCPCFNFIKFSILFQFVHCLLEIFHRAEMNPFLERFGCLNCNSESHDTNDCILPFGSFSAGSSVFMRRMGMFFLKNNLHEIS